IVPRGSPRPPMAHDYPSRHRAATRDRAESKTKKKNSKRETAATVEYLTAREGRGQGVLARAARNRPPKRVRALSDLPQCPTNPPSLAGSFLQQNQRPARRGVRRAISRASRPAAPRRRNIADRDQHGKRVGKILTRKPAWTGRLTRAKTQGKKGPGPPPANEPWLCA